jgi:hypothetical protein
MMTKNELLKKLRECAENVKEGKSLVNIPVNECHLDPGSYSGEALGALIYFIADMLE